jgi:ribose transport system permease protein
MNLRGYAKKDFKTLVTRPLFLVYVVLAAMFLAAQIISPGFLSIQNMGNILTRASFLGMVAIGQTLVILTGGIDMSIAAVITLTNLVSPDMMSGNNANILPTFMVCMFIGLLVGLINGTCINGLKIPAIIMTLATGQVLQGIGLIYSKGAPKGYAAPLIQLFCTGRLFGIFPYVVILWAVLAAFTIFLLRGCVLGARFTQ